MSSSGWLLRAFHRRGTSTRARAAGAGCGRPHGPRGTRRFGRRSGARRVLRGRRVRNGDRFVGVAEREREPEGRRTEQQNRGSDPQQRLLHRQSSDRQGCRSRRRGRREAGAGPAEPETDTTTGDRRHARRRAAPAACRARASVGSGRWLPGYRAVSRSPTACGLRRTAGSPCCDTARRARAHVRRRAVASLRGRGSRRATGSLRCALQTVRVDGERSRRCARWRRGFARPCPAKRAAPAPHAGGRSMALTPCRLDDVVDLRAVVEKAPRQPADEVLLSEQCPWGPGSRGCRSSIGRTVRSGERFTELEKNTRRHVAEALCHARFGRSGTCGTGSEY